MDSNQSSVQRFQDFDLNENILRALADLGFEAPSPIQAKALPLLLNKETDIIALAQTGTGKTAAFGIPILHQIDCQSDTVQALVLSPTRELCMQSQQELEKYGKYISGLKTVAVYGGAPIGGQIRDLKNRPQIIVATPGRLIDLLNRNVVDLSHVSIVVLDEADEMLNMGFRDDIDFILGNSPKRNTWLFSATMNRDVRRISKRYMKQAVEISVARENAGNEQIEHQYYVVNAYQRFEALSRLLDFYPDIYGIIFTRTKIDAQEVSDKLSRRGFHVSALHGDMDQRARTNVMKKFKQRQLQMLVATDVAARGIDVNDISHVINYELPDDPEVYTHRSGRTARAGKSGICLSLVASREISRIRQVERLSKTKFDKKDFPDGRQVIQKRLHYLLTNTLEAQPNDAFEKYANDAISEVLQDAEPMVLVQKLLWLQMEPLIHAYEQSGNLNAGYRKERTPSESSDKSKRLYLNLGTKDGMHRQTLIDYLSASTDMRPELFTHVAVRELSSFFNVPSDALEFVENAFAKAKFKGRRIRIEEAAQKQRGNADGERKGAYQGKKQSRNFEEKRHYSRRKNPHK